MAFCPNCGHPVDAGDRFCGNCGNALTAQTPVVQTVSNMTTRNDYRIVIISRGSCRRNVAVDMVSDLLGYSDPDAERILDNLPMEVAMGLTAIQAQYISQALSEYGMDVSIFNTDGYVDMGAKATSSVFDENGSFLSAVASVLTGITIGNRVSHFNRWTRPAPVVFRPTYRRPAPLAAYRRRIPVVRHAAPPPPPPRHPAPHPVAPPPPAPRRPAPAPAPRPAPGPSARPAPATRPAPAPRPAPATRPAPGPSARPAPGPHDGPGRPGGTGRGGHGPLGGGRRG